MSYYHECPQCGANLDPGERCDCAREKKETALDAANIQGGKIEHALHGCVSDHSLTHGKGVVKDE